MTLLVAASILLVSLALGSRGRAPGPTRRYSSAEVAAAIDMVSRAHPTIPRWFAWAMADKESGLRPGALHLDRAEDSLGLYQINWRAHGAELTRRGVQRTQLYIPVVNAAYWGQLAETWAEAARARGIEGDHVWYAVRLRAKGIDWDDFGSDLARTAILAFRPYVTKWKGRLGA